MRLGRDRFPPNLIGYSRTCSSAPQLKSAIDLETYGRRLLLFLYISSRFIVELSTRYRLYSRKVMPRTRSKPPRLAAKRKFKEGCQPC